MNAVVTKPSTWEEARRAIRQSGLRATQTRILVLLHMLEQDVPLSHADLQEQIGALSGDRTTIYRTLVNLSRVGLLQRTSYGGLISTFEVVKAKDNYAEPTKFYCKSCGKLARVRSVELTVGERELLERIGFVEELILRGYCKDCVSE